MFKGKEKTRIFDLKTTIYWGHRLSGVEHVGGASEIQYVMVLGKQKNYMPPMILPLKFFASKTLQVSVAGQRQNSLSEIPTRLSYNTEIVSMVSWCYIKIPGQRHLHLEYAFFLKANYKLFLDCVIVGAKNKIS